MEMMMLTPTSTPPSLTSSTSTSTSTSFTKPTTLNLAQEKVLVDNNNNNNNNNNSSDSEKYNYHDAMESPQLNIFDLPDEIIFHIFSTTINYKMVTNCNYINNNNSNNDNNGRNYLITTKEEDFTESLNIGELATGGRGTMEERDEGEVESVVTHNQLVQTIVNFSQTCKCFNILFKDERFWMKLYKTRFQFNSMVDMDRLCLKDNVNNNNKNNINEEDIVVWKNRFINRVHPWDMGTVAARKELVGTHQLGVTALTVDDQFLYSGSHDTSIKLYDMKNSLEPVHTLTGHAYTIWALKSNGRNKLYSGSNDQTIRVWNLKLLQDYLNECTDYDFNTTDTTDNAIHQQQHRQYTSPQPTISTTTTTTSSLPSSLTTSPIITSSQSPSPFCKKVIQTKSKVFSIELKERALFYSNAESINVIDTKTFEKIYELDGHRAGVNSMVVHGHHLLSASNDKTVRVWDINTMQCVTTREDPSAKILSLSVVDRNTLATGSNLYHIRLWDLRYPEVMNTISNAHKWEVWQLHMCGDILFSGSFDHTIKTWDLRNLKPIRSLTGHRSYIHAITSSSFHLFSGSADKSIKIWSPDE